MRDLPRLELLSQELGEGLPILALLSALLELSCLKLSPFNILDILFIGATLYQIHLSLT